MAFHVPAHKNTEHPAAQFDAGRAPSQRAYRAFDQLGQMVRYEQGELDESETITLFQELVNSGLVWQLQGSYGRMAHLLIRDGLVVPHNVRRVV